jgi:hypothetical protein
MFNIFKLTQDLQYHFVLMLQNLTSVTCLRGPQKEQRMPIKNFMLNFISDYS